MTMLQTAIPSTPVPDKNAPRPTAGVPPTLSPSEQRLRAVIEAVPVSIVACKAEGDILAANQAALELMGVKRLEELIGQDLKGRVAPNSREAFAEFVRNVCNGESGTLEYELRGPDDRARSVETRAVLLRRDGMAGTAFLAATWDITERKHSVNAVKEALGQHELLQAQCQTLEESVREAKASYELLSHRHLAVETSLREAQSQVDVIVTESQARHEIRASEWAAERDALEAKMRELQERAAARDALEARLREVQERESAAHGAVEAALREFQERQADLSAQLVAEQAARLSEIERKEREHAAALTTRMAEIQQLERTVTDMRTSYEVMLVGARTERDDLSATIHELERRCTHLVKERDVERERLENQVRAERTRCELLLSAHDDLRTKLASVAHALSDVTRGAECLVTECESARLLPELTLPAPASRPVQLPSDAPASPDSESDADSPWAF